MPALITNFAFKGSVQIMPGYLKSASCLLNSDCCVLRNNKASVLRITSPCCHPVLGGTQTEANDNNLVHLELADSRE